MQSLESKVHEYVSKALQQAITEATELVIAEAKTKFEAEVRHAVGVNAINLSNFFSIQSHGSELIIQVHIK